MSHSEVSSGANSEGGSLRLASLWCRRTGMVTRARTKWRSAWGERRTAMAERERKSVMIKRGEDSRKESNVIWFLRIDSEVSDHRVMSVHNWLITYDLRRLCCTWRSSGYIPNYFGGWHLRLYTTCMNVLINSQSHHRTRHVTGMQWAQLPLDRRPFSRRG